MINVENNTRLNRALSELYERYGDDYLQVYTAAFSDHDPPARINQFGIVDATRYNTDGGVLFIAKETNGWSNDEFAPGRYFLSWLHTVSVRGVGWHDHIRRHPLTWYNAGRWAMYLDEPSLGIDYISSCSHEAVLKLGTVAFTNINKVRGLPSSGKEYWELAMNPLSGELLRAELDILRPKTVVCCGTHWVFRHHAPDYHGIVIDMPHPGARRRVTTMLQSLASQYEEQCAK